MNCTKEPGRIVFTDRLFKYVLDNTHHNSPKKLLAEYKTLQKVKKADDWAFPVVEHIQRREHHLEQRFIKMIMENENGWDIKQPQKHKAAAPAGGSSSGASDGGKE